MVTIKVASNTGLDFRIPFRELFKVWAEIIKNKGQEIIIDLSNCRFCTCSFLLGIHLLRKDFEKKGYQISINTDCVNEGFASYLNRTSFLEGLNPDEMSDAEILNLFTRYKDKTYLPLLNFPATELEKDVRIRDGLLDFLSQSIDHKLHLDTQIKNAVSYLTDEAVNNIKDHSQAERGYVFTQFYPQMDFMDICIADLGVSILGSYQHAGKTGILSSEEALQAALDGESTKPGSNRGFGIRTSRRMLVHGLEGSYFIMSGDAFLFSSPNFDDTIGVLPKTPGLQWNGTYLALRIPVQSKSGFKISKYLE